MKFCENVCVMQNERNPDRWLRWCWTQSITLVICIATVLGCPLKVDSQTTEATFDNRSTFDEVCKHVNEKFWDPNFSGTDWNATCKKSAPLALAAKDRDEFAAVINEMLATLKTSHTHYFTTTDPKHYQLRGVFAAIDPKAGPDQFTYSGIGIETKSVENRLFVTAVYDGMPADLAGIRFGDEIVSVDDQPFRPYFSFLDKSGREVDVSVRRVERGETQVIRVSVVKLDGRSMFEHALTDSARVIERDGRKIGYVHMWSYAGTKYHDRLSQLVLWDKLKDCDGLILDLRDGWGGANIEYVNLFRPPLARIESTRRDAKNFNFTGVWGKPVNLLVNGGTTSGKELFAYVFQNLKLGQIIGSNTAGAVVAGQFIPLGNGDVLYLAVSDLKIDGMRLEGQGVMPDYRVERPLAFANGADPQLEKAIELIIE